MKRTVIVLVALLGATSFAQQPPEMPFGANINGLKLPGDMNIGEVSASPSARRAME